MSGHVEPSASIDAQNVSDGRRRWVLFLLVVISISAFVDRAILNTVGQAIKDDLHINDFQLGLLGGPAFALLYGILGLPIARLAERRSRVVIISIAVGVWSLMTTLAGFANNFMHLLLARIGVGIGEAGAMAPTHSLVADYYPPNKRASAIGILGLSTPIGLVIGGIGGAVFAEHFGWRSAFFLVGIPGLFLAILAWMTIPEPARGQAEARKDDAVVPPMKEVFRLLWESRTFRHVLTAAVIVSFMGYAVIMFTHPFFVRAFDMSYTDAAYAFALMNGISVTGGYLIGGLVTDRLARRDVRWYGWLPGICLLLTAPGYIIGYLQSEWYWALIILILPGFCCSTWFAPTYAITQNIVLPRMRATAVAIIGLVTSLIGMMLGPVVTGALSDYYAEARFEQGSFKELCFERGGEFAAACADASTYGVRYALITIVLLFFWAGAHFLLASRHMKRELGHLRTKEVA